MNEFIPIINLSKQYMNNTKIARIISTKQILIAPTPVSLDISIKETIHNSVDLWLEPFITSEQQVSQFDMAVMDAVYTLINNGVGIVTVEYIAKVLSGNMEQKVTSQKAERIQESIHKLKNIHIRIDCSEEIASRKDFKDKVEQVIYESCLLPVEEVHTKYQVNGKSVSGYVVLEKPALYEYAELVHQIVSVPVEWLQTQNFFYDTDEAIIIKRYTIKRIAQILNNNGLKSKKISFQWNKPGHETGGLFSELGYTPCAGNTWRTRTKPKINKIVRKTLLFLQEKEIIKGFKVYRADGTENPASLVMGYEIYI